MSHSVHIPDEFLAQLKDDLVCRRVGCGMARLDEHRILYADLDPNDKNAGRLLGYLAQWVDLGYERPGLIKQILVRFQKPIRAGLPLVDYLYLRLAEGMVAMVGESTAEAIRHFDAVLGLAGEANDPELLAITAFWKGRCFRMQGEYDQALALAIEGRELALALNHEAMAAVSRVLEAWLQFQRGDAKQAIAILEEAERVLRKTDDYLTLGNIYSSYGRIARRQGRYQHAIDNFNTAISLYKKRDPQHRNVARSLNNMAYVKRLIAVELRRKIDAEAARRRKAAARGRTGNGQVRSPNRDRLEQLHREALGELSEAAAIYQHYGHHHGLGSVHLNYAYLHLDHGDLDHAESEAKTAFALGEEKRDHILMARARMVLSMIENARVEEGIGDTTDAGNHARRADDPDKARTCYDQAVRLSKGDYVDSAWEDLESLKAKLLRSVSVNPILRAWSQGSVGDKTFQQISEEFAEIIIPKVWEREGRKVSRVAARLSVSPKKVRRILSRVGRKKAPST